MSKRDVVETMEVGSCLCPECGWTGGEAPKRRFWHWTRLGPIVLMACSLAALVVGLKLTGEAVKISSGTMYPMLVTPGFTEAQVEAIANGESSDTELANEVLKAAKVFVRWRDVERQGMAVAYLSPQGRRSKVIRRGWPIPWMTVSASDTYDDLLQRTGRSGGGLNPTDARDGQWTMPGNAIFLPARPTWSWRLFALSYTPSPQDTGGSSISGQIYLALLLIPVAACVAFWYALWIGAALASLIGINTTRVRSTKARLIIVAVFGILILGFDLLYTRSAEHQPSSGLFTSIQVGSPPGPTYFSRQEFRRLSVDLDEFETVAAAPDADKVVAQMIVDALGEMTSIAGGSLAVVADSEAIWHNSEYLWYHRAFPVVAFTREYFMRRSDFGSEELVKPIEGLRIQRQGSLILLKYANGVAEDGAFVTQIKADRLALVVVGIWLVWWLPHTLLYGIPRMRTARRRVSNRCIRCGYPVVFPS